MSCQCKCKPNALSHVTRSEGVVVWESPKCLRMLLKPENPSIILYDESGKVMWRDGSASQPIKLPAMQFGDVASTQYLVTYNESGELERVPVVPVEVTICPTVGSPFIAHVLAIPQ